MNLRSALLISIALAITVATGALHGLLRDRWGDPRSAALAAESVFAIPANVGDWRAVQSFRLSEREQRTLETYAHVGRVFQHQKTGQTVRLSLLLGPAGPTAVHRPEICLGSSEFRVASQRAPLTIGQRADRFWTTTFQGTDVAARPLRVVYAWRFSGPWEARQQPRFSYAGRPYLYKLTVSANGGSDASLSTCEAFLKDLLPALEPSATIAMAPTDTYD